MATQILQDALFAAIAAIGFAAISRPPRRAYAYCALLAAAGHSLRFALTSPGSDAHIIPATLAASFVIGCVAVLLSPRAHMPAESYLFPALLPMIPGVYAYRAFAGMAMCIFAPSQDAFMHSLYLLGHNALTCGCILLCMVTGAVCPIFMLRRISFRATR